MALGRRRAAADEPRIPRKDRRGANPIVVGLLCLLAALVLTYFGFRKDVPFREGFRVSAVFETSNSIRNGSPVRIAGVNVGKVVGVERYRDTDMSAVEMEIEQAGLPIHTDATAKIRPRIFLEGNFFVDLRPGTPAAPVVGDGDVLPVGQTSAPVQLGDVLRSLQASTRRDLQDLLRGYGEGLNKKPRPQDDAQADPDTRGETAAESLNDAADYGEDALRGSAIVNQAFLGQDRDDLRKLIDSLGEVTGALGRNDQQLSSLLVNFNTTMRAFGDEGDNLRATLRELPPTLRQANTTFASLNAAFPSTRAFARELIPGTRETPSTIDAAFPWIKQTRRLLQPDELQGLVGDLSPATRDLAKAVDDTIPLLKETDLTARCFDRVILPVGDVVIDDGAFSSGSENYKELFQSLVGFAGESSNFDGNGMYVRFNPGRGPYAVSTGNARLAGEPLFGNTDFAAAGTRPAYPGTNPPYRPDVPCYTNRRADLNSARTGPADTTRNTAPGSGTSQVVSPFPGTSARSALGGGGDGLAAGLRGLARAAAGGGARADGAKGGGQAPPPSLASELLDRLDPFRASDRAEARREAAPGKGEEAVARGAGVGEDRP